ncbi:Zinc finger protein 384 [Frankliniella fusca]|uniref:Zinc finger protein 384 n=1 Tax=Frankliniella fusca TaxID=407009 RepID=A0AAE1H129_9NEOP|nr:Zinc finger protein 384 [Frankliniella fusca]
MHKSAMQLAGRDLGRGDIKPHQCQQCLKSFSSNHQLVQHIRVHTGEKPYKCSYCERRFKQLSHVQQHTRLHTGFIVVHGISDIQTQRQQECCTFDIFSCRYTPPFGNYAEVPSWFTTQTDSNPKVLFMKIASLLPANMML